MTEEFIKKIIKECKKQNVPLNYYVEGWTSAITHIICATAAIICTTALIIIIGFGCK